MIKINKLINILNQDGQLVVSSRQISEDFEKRHSHVLTTIEEKMKVNPILGSPKYFIESTYIDKSNRKSKEYLLTRDGFSFLVMSFTGIKADSWKLKYIEAFNKMEQSLKEIKPLGTMELIKLQIKAMEEQEVKIKVIDEKVDKLENDMPLFQVDCKELQAEVRKKGITVLGGKQSRAYKDNSTRGKVYSDIQQQLKREFGINRYEALKRSKLNLAIEIVQAYKSPLVLADEIRDLNSQVEFSEVF